MKKIIYCTSSYQIGLTSLLTDQACSLVRYAPERFLFVSGEKEQHPGLFEKLRNAGAHYTIINGFDEHSKFFELVNQISSLVKEFRPDIIHVQTNWQLAVAVYAKYRYGNSYSLYYTLHGYRHNYAFRSVFALYLISLSLSLFVDKVYVSSTFLKNKFKWLKNKIEILFLGVDEEFFSHATPLPSLKEKKIIFPGEFRAGKNQAMLIQAVKHYIEKTRDTSITLYLPGAGEKLATCKALVRDLEIETNVIFPGFLNREQLLALYQKCHCAVVPTNNETFGLSIVEPFVLARVVISRKVGIAGDILLNAYNGFLFDTEVELAGILVSVFGDERLMHQVARRTGEGREVFRWKNITHQYLRSIDEDVRLRLPSAQPRPYGRRRVVIIWTRFLPYHVARIKHLKKRLDEIGCTLTAVEVASHDGLYPFGENSGNNAIDYVSCFMHTSYRELSARKIFNTVLEMLHHIKPDIVFAPATPFPSGMASARYRLENNTRSILMDDAWEHSDKRGTLVRWVKKNIHQNIDGAFIPDASHAEYYHKLGFQRDRLIFGVDVVDNDFFSEKADASRSEGERVRARLNLPEKYFLFVGRLLPIKGIGTLLEAYRRYRISVSTDAWDLVFVGDGREKHKIEAAAGHLSGIHLAGTRTGEGLCQYYGLASVLILPSDTETWGLVVNEAMASSLPVIVSKGCGCAEALVENGKNGWTFDVHAVDMLASLMKQCSSMSKEELGIMGKKSRDRINGWSLDTFADGVIAALAIPRRAKADIMANFITNFWTGRISFYP